MNNLSIQHRVQVEIAFTAEQWGLYTCRPGHANVAHILNLALSSRINHGNDREAIVRYMHVIMNGYRDMGAADTEPCVFLEQVLDEVLAFSA